MVAVTYLLTKYFIIVIVKLIKNKYTGKINYCHLEQHQFDLLLMAQIDVMYLSVVCTSLLALVDLFSLTF